MTMNNVKEKARIFLIDDHPVVRQGLTQLLTQESYVICGESKNRRETFEKVESSNADLALLDLSLGDESGLDFIAELNRIGIRVLVYSMHEDAETIQKAFDAGADGYISKREQESVLFHAVSEVFEGHRYLGPLIAQSLAISALSLKTESMEYNLSHRERKVLIMLGRGESNIEIASALIISIRTVETYFSRIIAKLGLKNMRELRKYAIKKSQTKEASPLSS